MKKKAFTYRPLSNKQKIKNQAKTIRQLNHVSKIAEIRMDYWKSVALEKQQLLNDRDRTIDSLKEQIGRLEFELQVKSKMPFWKKVFR